MARARLTQRANVTKIGLALEYFTIKGIKIATLTCLQCIFCAFAWSQLRVWMCCSRSYNSFAYDCMSAQMRRNFAFKSSRQSAVFCKPLVRTQTDISKLSTDLTLASVFGAFFGLYIWGSDNYIYSSLASVFTFFIAWLSFIGWAFLAVYIGLNLQFKSSLGVVKNKPKVYYSMLVASSTIAALCGGVYSFGVYLSVDTSMQIGKINN